MQSMGPSSMVLPFPHHHQGSSQPLPPPWSPCLHCHLCNSTLPWSRENNESEAQLVGFLTLTCSPGADRKMILKHSRSCSSPASEPSVPNLLWEISQNTDMKTMREGMRTLWERKKEGNRTKQNFTPTLRTESNLLGLAFEALCDLVLPNLFSLVPFHPCFTWMAQHEVPDEALLLPSTCWGCPSPATHSSRSSSGATSPRKPSDSSGLLNPLCFPLSLC